MNSRKLSAGFTIAELAVVLVIVGLLLGGLFVPLSAQVNTRNVNETNRTLNDIREALLGFAAANGRLPCPASLTTNGVESPNVGGDCNSVTANNAYAGFVPAVTLGVAPANDNGFVIDAWGNPIHYAVTTVSTNAFTTLNGIKNTTMASLAPDLHVCSSSTGITPGVSCGASNPLINTAVAVVFSTGSGGISVGRHADEVQNLAGTKIFVSHTPYIESGNEFDDLMIWLSPNTLYNRMIAAGQLP